MALAQGAFAPAEHCFANLWLFRDVHCYRLFDGPIPHLRGVTYDGETHALPLGVVSTAQVDSLFADGVDCLYPLTRDAADRYQGDIAANPADSDYWYKAADMATLAHAKTRRSQARSFAERCQPIFEAWHDDLSDDALHVLDGWASDITRPAKETDIAECREAISLADTLGLEGGVVRIGSKPVSFLLASRSGNTRVLHFAKGRRAFDGCYPWMFATYAAQSGAEWLNFEQDLGIPGLAQSKRAYAPHSLQPKYRVRKSLHI